MATQARVHTHLRRQQGIALTLVLLVLLAFTTTAVTLMTTSQRSMKGIASDVLAFQCLNVDMQAQVEAVPAIAAALPGLLGGNAVFVPESEQLLLAGTGTVGLTPYSYQVTVRGEDPSGATTLADQGIFVRSVCTVASKRFALETKGNFEASSVFGSERMCGCTSVELNSNYGTDGYDSALGDYASQTPTASSVGANGDILMDSNAQVSGDVIAGGDIHVDSNSDIYGDATAGGEVDGSSHVHGSTSEGVAPAPRPCDCSSYDIDGTTAAVKLNNDNSSAGSCASYFGGGPHFSIGSNDSCTFPSGTYYMESFVIDSNATVSLSGPVTMYWDEDGPFELESNGKFNLEGAPSDLQIFARTSETIVLDSNADLYFYVYAPNAELVQNSNVDFYGAVTAKALVLDSNGQFHSDLNATRQSHHASSYKPASWRLARN